MGVVPDPVEEGQQCEEHEDCGQPFLFCCPKEEEEKDRKKKPSRRKTTKKQTKWCQECMSEGEGDANEQWSEDLQREHNLRDVNEACTKKYGREKPFCKDNTCSQCQQDYHCRFNRKHSICNRKTNRCDVCNPYGQPPDNGCDKEGDKEEKCIPDKSNPNDYKCAKCVGDKDCKPDKPICAENECRKCMNDNECHYLPGEGLSIRKCLSTGKCGYTVEVECKLFWYHDTNSPVEKDFPRKHAAPELQTLAYLVPNAPKDCHFHLWPDQNNNPEISTANCPYVPVPGKTAQSALAPQQIAIATKLCFDEPTLGSAHELHKSMIFEGGRVIGGERFYYDDTRFKKLSANDKTTGRIIFEYEDYKAYTKPQLMKVKELYDFVH